MVSQADIDHIGNDGYNHRNACVLHPHIPAVEDIDEQGCGRSPQSDADIFACLSSDGLLTRSQQIPEAFYQRSCYEKKQGCDNCHRDAACQIACDGSYIATPESLCRESRSPHTEEGEEPKDEIDHPRSHSHCPDRVGRVHTTGQPYIHDGEERYGNVGDDIRNSQAQDAPVHLTPPTQSHADWEELS